MGRLELKALRYILGYTAEALLFLPMVAAVYLIGLLTRSNEVACIAVREAVRRSRNTWLHYRAQTVCAVCTEPASLNAIYHKRSGMGWCCPSCVSSLAHIERELWKAAQ